VRQGLGLGAVTLMGHSWGGTVAVAFAAANEDSVRRLVVIDGFAGVNAVDPAEASAEQERALDRIRDRAWFADAMADHRDVEEIGEAELCAWFRRRFPVYFAEPEPPVARGHIERVRSELRWNMEAVRSCAEDIDLRPALRRIRCPSLVVVGEPDWICGPTCNRPIAEVHRVAQPQLVMLFVEEVSARTTGWGPAVFPDRRSAPKVNPQGDPGPLAPLPGDGLTGAAPA